MFRCRKTPGRFQIKWVTKSYNSPKTLTGLGQFMDDATLGYFEEKDIVQP